MKLLRILFIIVLFFTLYFCCSSPNIELQVYDADKRRPIEGALVYLKEQHITFRTNVRGAVSIPAKYRNETISIHAKDYQSLDINLSNNIENKISLKFDETLVNPLEQKLVFNKADTLRGAYGKYRENNDLLFYDLNIKLNIEEKFISGRNSIKFKMLRDDNRIQIDLFENMNIDSIVFKGQKLSYTRDFNAVFIDFPAKLKEYSIHNIDFYYSGYPKETGRFGGIAFKVDSLGNPWIYTACQGIGASLWWPNKDQQPDEVDSMKISVAVPSELMDISNGRFMGKEDIGDGYTRYDWKVHYPINNYSVALNIGQYSHFSDKLGELTLDYYAMPYHLTQAKRQFQQAKPMLECFQKFFGEYPFMKDGFKLIEVPYSGMEHQSAVSYGNLFKNGYLGRDWTGVGVSMKFDFIIIHESGHEWFGNSVTANDVSDAWIQEGWCTYAEGIYVECMFGYEDAIKYLNGYKSKVKNKAPIIGPTSVNHWPTQDMYFKGALFLNTLRHVVDDDEKWWSLLKAYAENFKYKNIYTVDVINFFNQYFNRDFKSIFEQYLYHANLPVLQLKYNEEEVEYRWKVDVPDFDMPVKVRSKGEIFFIYPTSKWQSENLTEIEKEDWNIATDYFYIEVEEVSGNL